MNRRDVITGATVIVVGGVAGCGGDGSGPAADGGTEADGTGAANTGDDETEEGPSGYSGTGTEAYRGTWSSSELSGTWEFTVDWTTGQITGSTAGDVEVDISGSADAGTIEAEGEAAMGTVTWSGTFSPAGATVSGEWSGLGDAGDWSGSRVDEEKTTGESPGEPTEQESGDNTEEPRTEPPEETTENESEDVEYGTLLAYESNYTAHVEYSDPKSGESGTATARYHGSDYYRYIDSESLDNVYEVSHVDGETYAVVNGTDCYRNPGSAVRPSSEIPSKTDAKEQGTKPDEDLRPSGTTEIGGETVYVFEMTAEDSEGVETAYVSASTGYLRRVEANWGIATFHSWGETEPITPPSMDCQSLGS